MNIVMRAFGITWTTMLVILAGSSVWAAEAEEILLDKIKEVIKPGEPILPPGVTVVDGVGDIELVQGEAYVLHKGVDEAYRAAMGQPLFNGDTLVTGERSRVQVKLIDTSAFGLAEYSKLTINRVRSDANRKERESVVSLRQGKARFQVGKLPGWASSFQVKTPTAVAGVRGSEFGLSIFLAANAQPATGLVTGDDTSVSFSGMVGGPQEVGDFSVSSALRGGPSLSPVFVGQTSAMATLSSIVPPLAILAMPRWHPTAQIRSPGQ